MSKTKLFSVISLFTIMLISSSATLPVADTTSSASLDVSLEKAASYLLSMYNPSLGLVANSEDKGINPLGEAGGVPCNSTYWIYDDNLWAGWALQPFFPEAAANITKTVQIYASKYGRSMLFEAAIGEPVPTTIRSYRNVKVYDAVVRGVRIQILLDRHQYTDNSDIFYDASEYVDLCSYMAINYWMMGDANASEYWFRTGEKMWNYTTNNGFYDKAAESEGRYQNFKLGLFLLAQKATGFQSNITEKVEAAAWRYQNPLGGITAESWLDGSLYGTANAEATSALLLAYNQQLTDRLHKRQTYSQYLLELTETKLKAAEKTSQSLSENISDLTQENKALRDAPWSTNPWPTWFTVLLLSTSTLAVTSLALTIKMRKHIKRKINT